MNLVKTHDYCIVIKHKITVS